MLYSCTLLLKCLESVSPYIITSRRTAPLFWLEISPTITLSIAEYMHCWSSTTRLYSHVIESERGRSKSASNQWVRIVLSYTYKVLNSEPRTRCLSPTDLIDSHWLDLLGFERFYSFFILTDFYPWFLLEDNLKCTLYLETMQYWSIEGFDLVQLIHSLCSTFRYSLMQILVFQNWACGIQSSCGSRLCDLIQ